MMILEKLVEFVNTRNVVSQWIKGQTEESWQNHLEDAFYEFIRADDEHRAKPLAKMLIIVLSMSAMYCDLSTVFEHAYKRLATRAAFVLERRAISLDDELKMWDKGK